MREVVNCNVCVIGGAGFLGSHLVDHLVVDRGCKVLVLDNLISGQIKHIHKDATFIWIDSDQCIRCGKCLRVCPTEAITMRKLELSTCPTSELQSLIEAKNGG